jgi:hypothetical protein
MKMRRLVSWCALLMLACPAMWGQATSTSKQSAAVVFWEEGFPASDSEAPSRETLARALPQARFASAAELSVALNAEHGLLVLPYGSTFPESAWPAIQSFLQRGGNLLVLGGRPFLRAAYSDGGKWKLRDESVRFTRELYINDYRETHGSEGLTFAANPEWPVGIERLAWKRAWSPIIRLSVKDVYPRQGSAGSLDARLDTLVWGDKSKMHLAAPVIQIDHLQYAYQGSRWIFVQCELGAGFYQSSQAAGTIAKLAAQASRGSEDLSLRPQLPLFTQDETLRFHLSFPSRGTGKRSVKVSIIPEDAPARKVEQAFDEPQSSELAMPAVKTKGFHVVEASFFEDGRLVRVYHSGFWIRDEAYLRSGPKLSVNSDYFELDGKPLPVIGTTYMSSEVQRLYFSEPNAYVWDRDFAQISGLGLNMIRTGWWTDWASVTSQNAEVTDEALRSMEALLMSARRHNLPVQFTFFAFLPDVLGGENPYMDPIAVERQKRFVVSVVERFKDVPFLAYDLINEPSFSQYTWRTRPNGDHFELSEWNSWLNKKYPDRAKLMDDWNMPNGDGGLPVPSEQEFQVRGEYTGHNSLKIYDFYRFAQDEFTGWVGGLRNAIRATGSQQLITVGQDDGGVAERLSPAFFESQVDFTTNHTWWLNNELLWCSLSAKQAGKPMLIQETGLQRELTLNERGRRSDENEAALFERKLTTSFAQGTGALEWLWNINAYMSEDNEVPIGAVRVDGTVRPEGQVLSDMAHFVTSIREQFSGARQPDIAIVTSQELQYSVLNPAANLAQQRAVRALVYGARLPAYLVAENQLARLGTPKLVILPSPQAISAEGWAALLGYVRGGGSLLVSGALNRDEHWHSVDRRAELGIKGHAEPITFSEHSVNVGSGKKSLHFDLQAQNLLEWLHFEDGKSLQTITLGKGKLYWVDVPMELSEDLDSIAAIYSSVADMAHLKRPFTPADGMSSGIMVYPQRLAQGTLYLIASEEAEAQAVSLRDSESNALIEFMLPAQRSAMVLVRKSDGKVVAQYGVPSH